MTPLVSAGQIVNETKVNTVSLSARLKGTLLEAERERDLQIEAKQRVLGLVTGDESDRAPERQVYSRGKTSWISVTFVPCLIHTG